MLSVICVCILKFIFTVMFCFIIAFLILHFLIIFWICIFSLLLSSTAPYPQGPRIYLCPSSPFLSCGSLHLKKSCLLLSESSLPPHHSSLVSPVLRKSVSFSEELFLAASGRITLRQLLIPLFWIIFEKNYFILQRSSGYFYTGCTSYISYSQTDLNDWNYHEDMIEDYLMDNYEYSAKIILYVKKVLWLRT